MTKKLILAVWGIVLFNMAFFPVESLGQEIPEEIIYLSPKPGAQLVATGTSILVRLSDQANVQGIELTRVDLTGMDGTLYPGQLSQTSGGTYIYRPEQRFITNENIQVKIILETDKGERAVQHYFFSFQTSSRHPEEWPEPILRQVRELYHPADRSVEGPRHIMTDSLSGAVNDTMPPGYPEITVTHRTDPSPTYTFVHPNNYYDWEFYMIILDNFGTPVFYRSKDYSGTDFKLQPNGMITWWDASVSSGQYFVMDDRANILDTIGMGNGYSTDLHELRMEEDGAFWTLGYDPQIVGMDTVVPGGLPDATVIGLIVQKLDADENVVFQWRSWDHFEITDATSWISMTDSIIDYVHGNSIALESDTSILISSRNMAEITKIDTRTGEMIWRFGGENNQFEYIGSDQGFSVQHSIRVMNNGNYSIFDNGAGNTPPPHYSSAVEYEIDEEAMTATELQRIRRTPDIYAPFMGHAQRLDNGNTVCGWGPSTPSVTEFDPDGNMVLEFAFPYVNYRGFKFPWKTSLFDISVDTLDFGNLWPEVSDSAEVVLTNPNSEPLEINRIIHHGGIFTYDLEAPFTIPAQGEVRFTVHFEPDSLGLWYDVLTFTHEIHEGDLHQRLARQLFIKGENIDGSFIPGSETADDELFIVFPNPSSGEFILDFKDTRQKDIFIFNLEGKVVYEMRGFDQDKAFVSLENNVPGIYMIRVLDLGTRTSYSRKILISNL